MPGFEFRYRMSGKQPTIESFVLGDTETLSRGDMLNVEDGKIHLGRSADHALVGAALERVDGRRSTTSIRAIVDTDAVYAVEDRRIRLKGTVLELAGASGAQGVAVGPNGQLVVDVSSTADEETLVRIDGMKHYEKQPRTGAFEPLRGGELNAAVTRTVVRYYADRIGRGPTRAEAFHRGNILVVVLEGVLTTAERSLAAAGEPDAVLHARAALRAVLRPYLRSAVERLTGCNVRSFMRSDDVDGDFAVEVFVLDRPVPGDPAAGEWP